jgi:hypothetical protein
MPIILGEFGKNIFLYKRYHGLQTLFLYKLIILIFHFLLKLIIIHHKWNKIIFKLKIHI